jgi:hypothetical protein
MPTDGRKLLPNAAYLCAPRVTFKLQVENSGYGASADWKLIGEVRGGVQAFGELGSTRHLFPHAQHFVGPMVKTELEHLHGRGELGIEPGYLFAVGAARDEAKAQARLLLEYEFHL